MDLKSVPNSVTQKGVIMEQHMLWSLLEYTQLLENTFCDPLFVSQ